MYGLVNQAIKGLVVDGFGNDKWEDIKNRAGITLDYFVSDEIYDDSITFDLVAHSAEVLGVSQTYVLRAFGEYWIMKTGQEKYGHMMKAGGPDFIHFMLNLPNFHGRVMLIYPNIRPPEFIVEKIKQNELVVHYFSERNGLTEFLHGLIIGLAKMFNETIEIELIDQKHSEVWHDTFSVRIIN